MPMKLLLREVSVAVIVRFRFLAEVARRGDDREDDHRDEEERAEAKRPPKPVLHGENQLVTQAASQWYYSVTRFKVGRV